VSAVPIVRVPRRRQQAARDVRRAGWKPVPGPLKWFGGKGGEQGKIAKWIVSHFAPHRHYVEPYAGGLSVLLARDPNDPRLRLGTRARERGVSEVVNDIHGPLTMFWRVLEDPTLFADFARRVQGVSFCEDRWVRAHEHAFGNGDLVADAVEFFVHNRMSLGGRMEDFAALSKTRTRGNRNEQSNAWLGTVEGLPAVHERLRGVVVYNRNALDVIRREDGEDTQFYLDPTYPHETRVCKDGYKHEMTQGQHVELLALVKTLTGKVLLSGYRQTPDGRPFTLYDDTLTGWHSVTLEARASSGHGKTHGKRTEVLWANHPLTKETPDESNDTPRRRIAEALAATPAPAVMSVI
jgi:DNA adenine methylase